MRLISIISICCLLGIGCSESEQSKTIWDRYQNKLEIQQANLNKAIDLIRDRSAPEEATGLQDAYITYLQNVRNALEPIRRGLELHKASLRNDLVDTSQKLQKASDELVEYQKKFYSKYKLPTDPEHKQQLSEQQKTLLEFANFLVMQENYMSDPIVNLLEDIKGIDVKIREEINRSSNQ